MIHRSHNSGINRNRNRAVFPIILLILGILILSCTYLPSSTQDDSQDLAYIEVGVQQTLLAEQATQTHMAQRQQTEISLQTIQTVQAAQIKQTQAALQPVQPVQEVELAEDIPVQESQEEPSEVQASQSTTGEESASDFSQEAFEAYMQDAKILLYEDVVGAPWLARYAKDALDDMGLDYKDDGSAKGWLKSDLLSSKWDLVIIALEDSRLPPTGEYFDYINQAIDNGSAVILEIWFLNFVSRGEAAKMLSKCGVEFESDYGWDTGGVNDLINWPLPGKNDHPVFNEPNTGFRWTNIATITGPDIGDYIILSGKKDDAELLLGTIATEKNTHGTLALCNDGKFIIQTFRTHNLAYEEAVPLWQNYIYYVLKAKFLEGQ